MTKPKTGKKPPRKISGTADEPIEKRPPNDREAAAIASAREARKTRPARAHYVEEPSGADRALTVASPHTDAEGNQALLAETFATTSEDFVGSSMLRLANVTMRDSKPSVQGLNTSIAIVGAIAPRNELEAALATQMAATHELSLEMLQRTKTATTRDAMRDYGNLATKLSRTFTAQMKQLSDWRRGGEQVVRHVHVYEGGQAVVAETVNLRASGNGTISDQSHAAGAFGVGPALLGADPFGNGMPIPGSERTEALQDARRDQPRSAEGQ